MEPLDRQVLILDDDEAFAELARTALRRVATRVKTAGGSEALALARATRWDLVICALDLRPLSGIEVRRQLALDSSLAAVPFLFVGPVADGPGLPGGEDTPLIEPVDPEVLAARARRMLARAASSEMEPTVPTGTTAELTGLTKQTGMTGTPADPSGLPGLPGLPGVPVLAATSAPAVPRRTPSGAVRAVPRSPSGPFAAARAPSGTYAAAARSAAGGHAGGRAPSGTFAAVSRGGGGGRADPVSQLTGTLDAVPLSDVLQMLDAARATGVLVIAGRALMGQLTLKDGRILEARTNNRQGEDAALRLVWLRDGGFAFERQADVEAPEGPSWAVPRLLLDAAWLHDELTRLGDAAPGVSDRVEVLDVERALDAFPEHAGWRVLVGAGRGPLVVEALAIELGLSTYRLRARLGRLAQEGAVRVLPAAPERPAHAPAR